MATTVPPPATHAPQSTAPPRLADGVELIGRFEDSGFKDPPYIARRADGQVVQMKPMLFALAEEVDGRRSNEEIATALSHRIKRGVTGEMAEMLIEEQLRPLGIVAPRDGKQQELRKVDPLLALKFRAAVVPDRVVHAITTVFRPLFLPPLMAIAVGAFLGLDAWLFAVHGISQSLRHTLYEPALLLALLGGVVLATAFHEIGHATGCRYGGAKPGVMGVGIYIVWPAFYTDITDAYRLGKWGRLRADVGGMYFNAIFALAVGAAYALTGFEPLLLLVVLQTFAIVQQSLPFLRLDGYYIVSDLTGVPDILTRIRPVLASLLPWRKADERVKELKPWVRVAVTTYLVLLVPVIGFVFALMVINAPRLFATAWDSFWTHYDLVGPAFEHSRTLAGVKQALQMVVLVLPAIGFAYTAARITARGGLGAWRWSDGSLVRRSGVVLAGTAVAGAIAFTWWPNGDYRPIQPGERGTLTGGLRQLQDITSGRAALTPQRQQQLHGAPTQRRMIKHRTTSEKPAPPPKHTAKAPATSSIRGVSQKPHTSNQAPPEQSTTPDASSPPPDTTATTPDQAPATTAPSDSPPPDQTATQPQQQPPPPQDSGTQTAPPPTSP